MEARVTVLFGGEFLMTTLGWLVGIGPMICPIIYVLAGFCLAALAVSIILSNNINKQMSSKNEPDYKRKSFHWLNLCYNIFLALVSIFPLLGMLGTVLALLGLDLSSQDTSGLQQQFFLALDTTALGLVCSIGFKFAHSFVQTKIETAIAKIDEITKASFK